MSESCYAVFIDFYHRFKLQLHRVRHWRTVRLDDRNATTNAHRQQQSSVPPSAADIWGNPRDPVEPFSAIFPDEVLRPIFEYACTDLATAYTSAFVARHIRQWVEPILYSRVRLVGIETILLFARTVESRPPHFFTHVKSLAIVPQEERILVYYRNVVEASWRILSVCTQVEDLEICGDLLRRTVTVEPVNEQAHATPFGSTEIGLGDLPPEDNVRQSSILERASMRPTRLTLLSPIQNVQFNLPMLRKVTHLHYNGLLPRSLHYQRYLLDLSHIAFDFKEGSVKTDILMATLRDAMTFPSATPITPQPEDEEEQDQESYNPPGLSNVVVRVLLRTHVEETDRPSEIWRKKLETLVKEDDRVVYFESKDIFGDDVWEQANIARQERQTRSWYRVSM